VGSEAVPGALKLRNRTRDRRPGSCASAPLPPPTFPYQWPPPPELVSTLASSANRRAEEILRIARQLATGRCRHPFAATMPAGGCVRQAAAPRSRKSGEAIRRGVFRQRVRVAASQLGRFEPCDGCRIEAAPRRRGCAGYEPRSISRPPRSQPPAGMVAA
jgi:hypothetical protein